MLDHQTIRGDKDHAYSQALVFRCVVELQMREVSIR